jgi:hypothetical protein
MLTGNQLRKLFHQFNGMYFAGTLPAYHIRVVGYITSMSEHGRCLRNRKLIKLSKRTDKVMIGTLLHEMAHAATTDHHGLEWRKEMIRLREAGAPLQGDDLNVNLHDWDETRIRGRPAPPVPCLDCGRRRKGIHSR